MTHSARIRLTSPGRKHIYIWAYAFICRLCDILRCSSVLVAWGRDGGHHDPLRPHRPPAAATHAPSRIGVQPFAAMPSDALLSC